MFDAIATPALNRTAAEVAALVHDDYVDHVIDSVVEWHKVFEQTPTLDLQMKLISEELRELADAGIDLSENESTVERVANFLKEHADVAFTSAGLQVISNGFTEDADTPEQFVQMLRFLGASERVGQGVAVATIGVSATIREEGWDQETFQQVAREAFRRVVQSNLSKLGPDGKPVFNEDGKIMKGSNYVAPNLNDLAETLIASKGIDRSKLN